MLHYPVVLVGVNAEIGHPVPTPVETSFCNSVAAFRTCKPMYRAISLFVIEPLAAFNFQVGLLYPGYECEIRFSLAGIFDDVADTSVNILPDYFFFRITVGPLLEIAVRAHYALGFLADFQYAGNISISSSPYLHFTYIYAGTPGLFRDKFT